MSQVSFGILAAFFVVLCVVWFAVARHGYAVCILLGILLGVCNFAYTQAHVSHTISPYLGQTVFVKAQVLSCGTAYMDDMSFADLQIVSIDEQPVDFMCYVPLLPMVEEGDVIEGSFTISRLEESAYMYANYADGCFVQATYDGQFAFLEKVGTLRHACQKLQEKLSTHIRQYLPKEDGAVLAAMTVGDQTWLTSSIKNAYRRAGVSHILVISGLHLALFCGLNPISRKNAKYRKLYALGNVFIAIVVGAITGLSASILRAGFMVLLCNIGVFLYEKTDGFTSLSLAGALLLIGNSYVGCGLSFQLSFMATFGVLCGVSFAKQICRHFDRTAFAQQYCLLPKSDERFRAKPRRVYRWLRALFELICVSMSAILFNFPILVLWDMDVSVVALGTNLLSAVFVVPILTCGFLCACTASMPILTLAAPGFALVGGVFVRVLNAIVYRIAAFPFAAVHFQTAFAAGVVTVIALFGVCAVRCRAPKRVVFLVSVLLLGLAVGAQRVQHDNLVRVAIVGSASNPAVVITRDAHATVLFRGNRTNEDAVLLYLAQYGMDHIDFVVELSAKAEEKSDLPAERWIFCSELDDFQQSTYLFDETEFILYNTGDGIIVLFELNDVVFATTSSDPTLATPLPVDVLLADARSPGSVEGEIIVARSNSYDWYAEEHVHMEQVYYGEEPCCVARYGCEFEITGVQDGARTNNH